MQMRPLLFLDIDGVLNCLGDDVAATHTVLFGDPDFVLPVALPQGFSHSIAQLDEAFEIVWANSWRSMADPCWSPLTGCSWPHLQFDRHKLTAIACYAGARPWAWVDDEASWELAAYAPQMVLGEHFIVCPDPACGLTPVVCQRLLEWAARRVAA